MHKTNWIIPCLITTLTLAMVAGCGGGSKQRRHKALSMLEMMLSSDPQGSLRPAPGNQIRPLSKDAHGLAMLQQLDQDNPRFAFDPGTTDYLLVWNGPAVHGQVLFTHQLTAGIPSQIQIDAVELEQGEARLVFTASSKPDDEAEVTGFFGLKPGSRYEVRTKVSDLAEANLLDIWRKGMGIEGKENTSSTQP